MKKLSFIILLAGIGILMTVPGLHAQMMGQRHGNLMYDGNSESPLDTMQMSDMVKIEDSLDTQSKMIIAQYDSLQMDFDTIMKISDMQKLKNALKEHRTKMASFRNRLSHFEELQADLDMKIKARTIINSMHGIMDGMSGLGRLDHEDR
jgi:hypothetical protein